MTLEHKQNDGADIQSDGDRGDEKDLFDVDLIWRRLLILIRHDRFSPIF